MSREKVKEIVLEDMKRFGEKIDKNYQTNRRSHSVDKQKQNYGIGNVL